jgi:hypothetical protein
MAGSVCVSDSSGAQVNLGGECGGGCWTDVEVLVRRERVVPCEVRRFLSVADSPDVGRTSDNS